MQRKKAGWKKPAILFLALLLLLQIADLVRLRYFDSACHLPVLMYHHFDTECFDSTVVSPERFREQMTALRDAGYQAVTIPQIIDYVENETPLPEKPVLITMDDGYTSNLVNAAPVLEELGLRATVFVIGVNEGEEIYIHNGEPLSPPRFSYEEAAPWVEKGVIDVQSHTFDMHQVASYGYSCRDGMLAMDGETDEDYHRALLADLEQFSRRRAGRVSTDLIALAFPFGYYNRGLDDALLAEGIAVTFTIDERINRLPPHDGRCLRMMGRFNVTEDCSGEELVRRLNWSAGH